MIQAVEKPEDLNTSSLELFKVLYENSKDEKQLTVSVNSWVDVRDVAEAHVVALEKPEAGGERILFAAGKYSLPLRVTRTQLPTFFESRSVRLARLQ